MSVAPFMDVIEAAQNKALVRHRNTVSGRKPTKKGKAKVGKLDSSISTE